MPVPKTRNTREENKIIKSGEEPEHWKGKPAKRSQKDVDARWTKKHGKSHYGYKKHVNVDRKHKLVRRYHVSDAALHDSQAVGLRAPWSVTDVRFDANLKEIHFDVRFKAGSRFA